MTHAKQRKHLWLKGATKGKDRRFYCGFWQVFMCLICASWSCTRERCETHLLLPPPTTMLEESHMGVSSKLGQQSLNIYLSPFFSVHANVGETDHSQQVWNIIQLEREMLRKGKMWSPRNPGKLSWSQRIGPLYSPYLLSVFVLEKRMS